MSINIKYTSEQEKELEDGYKSCESHDEREDYILKYMGKHNKSKRSVIAKLSKMNIYVPRPKISKVTNEYPETKESMVSDITVKLGLNDGELEGLVKTPKLILLRLRKRIEELL